MSIPSKLSPGTAVEYEDADGTLMRCVVVEDPSAQGRIVVRVIGRKGTVWFAANERDRLSLSDDAPEEQGGTGAYVAGMPELPATGEGEGG